MDYRVRYLPLSEVTEGMVLGAQVVLAERGVVRFSLPAGHSLTDANLRQLAIHHAEFVCIREEERRSDEERAQAVAAHERRLAHIFRSADLGDPTLTGLYNAVLAYRRS